MTDRISVLVSDDHAVLRAGLRALIDAQPDMTVIGEAGDAAELMRLAPTLQPDIVLLDITMPGPGFRETIQQLVRECRDTKVLVLTMHDDPAYLRASLIAGASGFVVKKAADSELIAAIRAVRSGRLFVDLMRPEEKGKATDSAIVAVNQLSPREQQVLRLLAQGLTNQQIAEQVFLSVKTIETYRARLYSKLQLKSRAQLFQLATAAGLLDADSPRQ